MIIQIKDGLRPIRLKTVRELPTVGSFLYIHDKDVAKKVIVEKVESVAVGVIVTVAHGKFDE